MISIDFLKGRVDGLEFIDFQNKAFYNKFSSFLEDYIDADGVLSGDCIKGFKAIVEEFTGFSNVKVILTDEGNLSVDTGFFTPNHVMNNEGIDELLKHTQTTLYRWFTQNKERVFKGTIDYSTGKVGGDFKTVPVEFRINRNLNITFPKDRVGKYGIPLQGILAGCTAHELGHIFGACMMMHTMASDDLLAKAGLSYFKGSRTQEERVIVLQDVASLLDVKSSDVEELQAISANNDESSFILYYNKMIAQRNTRRSLSVGVERMSSEVVADMYAIRMGCDDGIIAAIGILVDIGAVQTLLTGLLVSSVLTFFLSISFMPIVLVLSTVGSGAVLAFMGLMFTLIFLSDYFSKGYSGTYNSGHRRFDDALRQLINRFKEEQGVPSKERQESIDRLKQLLAINEKLKPWYDNTVIHRMVGRIFSGNDFTLTEIEHYTSVLSNHELNLLSDQFKLLK